MLHMAKRKKAGTPSPAEIRAIRRARGLTIEQAAASVGVKPRTWLAWELPSQKRTPSPSHVILIRLLENGDL